ncbi:hypothetical protein [Sporosarcina sp. HYO08]|uniref:hypothetical protein n=1 Tax=Sporosarcina sp. HYO08 TaxID=1759557 RepID=UPI000798990B|nr:hypothetical protein [Sporosarcina sp. HYO08]KXH78576.1 hypothetical protein AU377_12920 [Sporosarcina sp. HYO08]
MQDKRCNEGHGRELICINVDKVYDWIVKEKSFDISPTEAIAFPALHSDTSLANAVVTCEVTPAAMDPVVILNREDREFCIDGKKVCLQQLTIQKNFTLTVIVTVAGGTLRSVGIPVSRCEQVTLCAPEGTDVEVTYTDLDCFVCSTGALEFVAGTPNVTPNSIRFTDLNISVSTCQSIQSTFPVTVEFSANFCEPREDFPTAACPAPTHPKQCPAIFPDTDHRRH